MRYRQVATRAVREVRTPARPSTVESDVVVPAVQAAISGALAGLLVGLVALVTGAEQPATIGVVSGAVVLAATWLVGLRDRRALLWAVERTLGTDLDRDGKAGPPERPKVTTVEIVDRQRQRVRYVSVPLTDDQLTALAQAALRPGGTFSRRSLPAGLVSDEAYSALVAQLLDAGLLAHRGRAPGERRHADRRWQELVAALSLGFAPRAGG